MNKAKNNNLLPQKSVCVQINNNNKKSDVNRSGVNRSGVRRRCCFPGCKTTNRDKDTIKMSVVTAKPKQSYTNMADSKVDSIKCAMYRHYLRYYTLDRCGIKDDGEEYHLCKNHEMEKKVVRKKFRERRKISQSQWSF